MTGSMFGRGRAAAGVLLLGALSASAAAQSTGVIGAPFEDVVDCQASTHGLTAFDFSSEPNTGAACTTLPWTPKATLSVPGEFQLAERLVGQTKFASAL